MTERDDSMPQLKVKPIWERHVQTILLFVLTGLCAWAGSTLVDSSKQNAATDAKLEYIVAQISTLQGDVKSLNSKYMPRADAEANFKSLTSDISSLRDRVSILEGKVGASGN